MSLDLNSLFLLDMKETNSSLTSFSMCKSLVLESKSCDHLIH